MKRILIVVLCTLLLPFAAVQAETELPEDESNGTEAWDPNWVLWEEPDETVEAFAEDGQGTAGFLGMRPLSRYAQTFDVTEEDLNLAARVAYFEAGWWNEKAYRAVLCVLYNRCVATRFGGKVTSISTEAYRKGQFSVIHNKKFKKQVPPQEIMDAARDIFVYGNLDLPESILFFCSQSLGKSWGGRRFYKNIGGNLFFYGKTE
ncbi:MAG: cell wall hydrolase [Clostridia bacterium]|jgi:hypothetical protein|nr:cell wall hydrolase [Clostridia bacterium]MDO4836106.1 cell wall hydrolase [Clostridia bacterium]